MLRHLTMTGDHLFRYETFFISMYYLEKLRKHKFIKCWRINIDVDIQVRPYTIRGKNAGVCDVFLFYDVEHYCSLPTEDEKNLTIVNLFHQAFMELTDEFGWDKSVFEQIKCELIDSHFKVELKSKKFQNSPKEKVLAQFVKLIEKRSIKFYVNF